MARATERDDELRACDKLRSDLTKTNADQAKELRTCKAATTAPVAPAGLDATRPMRYSDRQAAGRSVGAGATPAPAVSSIGNRDAYFSGGINMNDMNRQAAANGDGNYVHRSYSDQNTYVSPYS